MRALFETDTPQKTDRFVHRLDARTKMGVSLLASVAVILMNHPVPLAVMTLFSAIYAFNLKRIKLVWIIYAVVVLMWCIAVGMMTGLHLLWPRMAPLELDRLMVPFLRTTVMVNVALALALSTRTQSFLSTFKALRLPFPIYVPLAVMIRFIPTFIEDIRQIRECARTRGHRITPVFIIRRPVLFVRLLLMPLLFRSLRSSDELGIAAELKGLGHGKRMTPLHPARFGREDAFMAGFTLAALAAVFMLQILFRDHSGGML
jgi:energy-coupling factor transport system permease protein